MKNTVYGATPDSFLRMPFLEMSGTKRNRNLAIPNGWKIASNGLQFIQPNRKDTVCGGIEGPFGR
jgi:hypothetical protein